MIKQNSLKALFCKIFFFLFCEWSVIFEIVEVLFGSRVSIATEKWGGRASKSLIKTWHYLYPIPFILHFNFCVTLAHYFLFDQEASKRGYNKRHEYKMHSVFHDLLISKLRFSHKPLHWRHSAPQKTRLNMFFCLRAADWPKKKLIAKALL